MKSFSLETDRLTIRPLMIEDAKDMYEYTSDVRSNEFLVWEIHNSVEQDKEFINNALKPEGDDYYFGVELNCEKKLIGCIRLYDISDKHKRCEVSYIINPNYSCQGYATEALRKVIDFAFDELNMNRVQALCIEGHIASEKVMKKCSMIYEGTLASYAILRDQKTYPMKMYARVKSDDKQG